MRRFYTIPLLAFASILLSMILTGSIAAPKANALVGSQFNAGRIMDDGVFFNGYSMDVSGIQAFLNAKVPVCDTNGTQAYNGTTRAAYGASQGSPAPYVCLKNYQQSISAKGQDAFCGYVGGGTKSAAQIIYDVSVACSVNPKVLLVLLQKEQILVTDDWPFPIQYQSATGFGCPDTASCDSTYYGFFNQVYNAARQYQRYAKQSSTFNYRAGRTSSIQYNPNASCGSSGVFIENQATAGLYNYTPYQPNTAALNNLYGNGDSCSAYGNRNFWRLYSDWFGSPITNGLPSNASLYIASPSGKVYLTLIDDGTTKNYYIPNWDTLIAYNLTNGPIVPVTDSYIASGGTTTTLYTTYSPKASGAIFLADQGRGFHIGSWQNCTDWNLPCGSAPELPLEFTNWLNNAGLLPAMFVDQGVAYKPTGGLKQPFARVSDIFDSGYVWNNFVLVQSINANIPLGAPIIVKSAAVKFSPNDTIYYFDGTNYFAIPSYEVLTAWGLNNKVISPPNSSYNTTPPVSSATLTTFVSDTAGIKYLIDGGVKLQLSSSAQAFWPSASYQAMTTESLDYLPTGQLKNFISSGSSIYLLDYTTGKKRPIISYDDLITLGYTESNVTYLSNSNFSAVPSGPPKIADGSVISIQETGGIYVVSNEQLLHIDDWGTLSSYQVDLNKVVSLPSSIASTYPYGSPLALTTKDSSTNHYFFSKMIGYKVDQAMAVDLGLKTSSYQSIASRIISNANVNKNVSRFFVNEDNGRIYYGSGGGIHYVGTYKAFLDYGGNSSVVIPVNSTIINSFIVGPDV